MSMNVPVTMEDVLTLVSIWQAALDAHVILVIGYIVIKSLVQVILVLLEYISKISKIPL